MYSKIILLKESGISSGFISVAAALAAAEGNDVVMVYPGTVSEEITVASGKTIIEVGTVTYNSITVAEGGKRKKLTEESYSHICFQSQSNFGAQSTVYGAFPSSSFVVSADAAGRLPLLPGVYDLMDFRAPSNTLNASFDIIFRVDGQDTLLKVTPLATETAKQDAVNIITVTGLTSYGTVKFVSASGGGACTLPAVRIRYRHL